MKITVTQRTTFPGLLAPRLFLYGAALLTAPFTSGVSLLAFPIGCLAFGAAKRDARRQFRRVHPCSEAEAARKLLDSINSGRRHDAVEHEASPKGDEHIPIARRYLATLSS